MNFVDTLAKAERQSENDRALWDFRRRYQSQNQEQSPEKTRNRKLIEPGAVQNWNTVKPENIYPGEKHESYDLWLEKNVHSDTSVLKVTTRTNGTLKKSPNKTRWQGLL